MNLITYDEFKKTKEYEAFIKENPSIGHLKIYAFTAYKAVPVENVEVLITKDFGENKVIFFNGYTNSSGTISNIELPAPNGEFNATTFETPRYTLYDLSAIDEEYESIKKYNIGMFGDVNIIQYLKMIPKVELSGENNNGN